MLALSGGRRCRWFRYRNGRDFDSLHLVVCLAIFTPMIVFTLRAAAKEPRYLSDGAPMVTIVVITKSQLILDGVGTVLVIFVAIAVGCLFAHIGEDLANGVDIHIFILFLEVGVQLAEARIRLLSESRRRPYNQAYKCIASVHGGKLLIVHECCDFLLQALTARTDIL